MSDATDEASQPSDPKTRFSEAVAAKQAGPGDGDHEEDLWSGSYSHLAMLGTWVGGAVVTVTAIVLALLLGADGSGWFAVLVGVGLMWLALAGWYGYRRLSVRYSLTTQRLLHESGLLWRTVDRIELIDIDDVTYRQGPLERLLGVGTIFVISTDRSSPELRLPGIEAVREVADAIDDARRKERRSRGLHIEQV